MIDSSTTTVLLVEDSLVTQRILEAMIKANGYAVISCSNGIEALEYLEKGSPVNLVLTDLQMPGMDGLTFVKQLRSDYHHTTLPVILLTASEDSNDYNLARNAGVNAFLTKPCDFWELNNKIKQTLPDII